MSVCLSASLFVWLLKCRCIFLFDCLSVCLSIRRSVSLSDCITDCLFCSLADLCLSVCLSVCLTDCLFFCLNFCLSDCWSDWLPWYSNSSVITYFTIITKMSRMAGALVCPISERNRWTCSIVHAGTTGTRILPKNIRFVYHIPIKLKKENFILVMVFLVSFSMFAGFLYLKGEAENCDDLCTANQYCFMKFFVYNLLQGGHYTGCPKSSCPWF